MGRFWNDFMLPACACWMTGRSPNAPAPALRFGVDAWVMVAVQPASTSNHVEVAVRVNDGPMVTIGAKWLRNDDETGAQPSRFTTLLAEVGGIAGFIGSFW